MTLPMDLVTGTCMELSMEVYSEHTLRPYVWDLCRFYVLMSFSYVLFFFIES